MTTPRKYTLETAAVDAAFLAVHALCRRTYSTLLLVGQVVVAVSLVAAALAAIAWDQLHAEERAFVTALPGRLVAGWTWLDRRAVVVIEAVFDGLYAAAEYARPRLREALARLAPRDPDERDEYDDLYAEHGDPVGRAA